MYPGCLHRWLWEVEWWQSIAPYRFESLLEGELMERTRGRDPGQGGSEFLGEKANMYDGKLHTMRRIWLQAAVHILPCPSVQVTKLLVSFVPVWAQFAPESRGK